MTTESITTSYPNPWATNDVAVCPDGAVDIERAIAFADAMEFLAVSQATDAVRVTLAAARTGEQ